MHDIKTISELFDLRGDYVYGTPYGSGHINDTFAIWLDQAGIRIRYILQRLAHNVFKQPIPLMENVQRVTSHALKRLLEDKCPEAYRRTLTIIPAKDGKPYALDEAGNCWRIYPFIERARTYDTIETTKQCIEAAKAFGEFQKLTADMPGKPLFETIPNFHNTTARLNALKDAIKADPLGRVQDVQREIDWYMARESDCHIVVNDLRSGALPLRCTHNDTKLNNVMLDDVTGEGVCVIDLDTTMPGSAVYDFGDMIRTATSPATEDEKDLSLVTMRMFMFEALVQGYLSSASSFLTPREKDLLPFSGILLTMECGIRFLTDYISGDVYFKIKRPEHNMDRCRTQMALVESIEKQMDSMKKYVESFKS